MLGESALVVFCTGLGVNLVKMSWLRWVYKN